MKTTSHTGGFSRRLAIYALVLLLLFSAGLTVFWRLLAAYERSLPETAVDAYLDDMDKGAWTQALRVQLSFSLTPFETADGLYTALAEKLQNARITALRDYTATGIAYVLRADGQRFARLTLADGGKAGFGMQSYRVEDLTFLTEAFALDTYTAVLTVPAGASASINGVPVDESYRTETSVDAPQASKYERGTDRAPKADVYRVDGLFYPCQPAAAWNGTELTYTANGAAYLFAYPAACFHSLYIRAPENSVISLGGYLLEETPLSAAPYPAGPYETARDDLPRENTYRIDGLYKDMPVEAAADGIPLAGETFVQDGTDGIVFAYPHRYTLRLEMPADAQVSVNGTPVREAGEEAVYDGFDAKSYSWRLSAMPACRAVTIDNLLLPPVVTHTGTDAVHAVSTTQNGSVFTAVVPFPTEDPIPEGAGMAALHFTKALQYYTASGYSGVDENLAAVLRCTLPDSEAYRNISGSKIGVEFNTFCTVSYRSLVFSGCTRFTPECVRVYITYDLDRTAYGRSTQDQGTYAITLVLADGAWQVAEFSIR